MDETFRPLTAQEREVLERLRASAPRAASLGAFLAFLVTLGVLLLAAPASWQFGVRSLVPVLAALLVGGVVYLRSRRSARRNAGLEHITRDLAGGVVSVATYRVTDALQVEEFEDEGSSYYLKLADGRVAFLSGQYLYEVEEAGAFPSTIVSVVRTPHAQIVFDVRCEGRPLRTGGRLPSFTTSDYEGGHIPDDGALVEVDFESLRYRATRGA